MTLAAGSDVYLTLSAGFGATQGAGWIVLQHVQDPDFHKEFLLMARFLDLVGTTLTKLQIGLGAAG